MAKRLFTLREARAALPSIRVLAGKLIQVRNDLDRFQAEAAELAAQAALNSGGAEATAYFDCVLLLHELVRKIEEFGCHVKNVEEGLLDFPHLMDGREVYLCWHFGEEDIAFWHEVDAGFAGRTPIVE